MSTDAVSNYYSGFGEREWNRLTTPVGSIEFAVNTYYISQYLPSGARVLDLGGGPGRYALWLAGRGHSVVLADLSTAMVDSARKHISESPFSERIEVTQADARDLSRWQDASFDAVLCLGPFYHLVSAGDRAHAARELVRVCKPAGRAFIALMPHLIFIRRTISLPDEVRHLEDPAWVLEVMEQGVFRNDVPGRFALGYAVRPEEVPAIFEPYGLRRLKLLASEGITAGIERELADLAGKNPALYERALDLVIQTAADPSILGMASHLLYIAEKE